jgi:DNA-binding transcriptional MerR regulator
MENGNDSGIGVSDKIYFKIGEVSSAVGIPAYVLRFWESEFDQIRPKRTSSGQRLYRKKDIALITTIKDLLYNKKFTIPGAKRYIRSHSEPPEDSSIRRLLYEIRSELQFLRNLLD